MRVDSTWGRDGNDYAEVGRALAALETALGQPPDVLFFHGGERCNPRGVAELVAARWPRARLHGGSSGLGVMTRGHIEPGSTSFGLLGIVDGRGAYGVGAARLGAEPRAEVKAALAAALAQAGRPGEVPALVLLTARPGQEEELLLGIADVVGAHVPVAGGSSGDDAVTGQWWQLANREVGSDLCVVSVLFPSGGVVSSFQSGFEVTPQSGKITRATGRHLHEIDGRPAARVYDEWTNGAISDGVDILEVGGKIPQRTSALHPLGRRAGASGGVVEFVLSFLDTALPDGTLTLYTEVRAGEQVWAMRGTEESLVGRAGRVALDTVLHEGVREQVRGAIVMFCAASAVHIRERMPEVVAGLDVALGDCPYIGTFTFGEQGRFLAGGNRHGNMMISVVLFVGKAGDAGPR